MVEPTPSPPNPLSRFKYSDPNTQALADRILARLQSAPTVGSNGAGGSSRIPGFLSPIAPSQGTAMEQVLARKDNTNYRGKQYSELPAELRRTIDSVARMNHDTAAYGGTAPKKHNSIFNRVIDVLSRPLYAVANTVKQEAEYVQGGEWGHAGIGLLDPTTVKEAWQGFSGKDKTHFSDVFQEVADNTAAKQAGKTVAESGDFHAKVNPWLKYGAGLVADIAFDPTTYLGVGLAKDAIQVGVQGRNIAKAATAAAQVTKDEARAHKIVKAAHDLGIIEQDGKIVATSKALTVDGKLAGNVRNVPPEILTQRLGAGRRGAGASRKEKEKVKRAALDITSAILDAHKLEDLGAATEFVNITQPLLRHEITSAEIMPHYRRLHGDTAEEAWVRDVQHGADNGTPMPDTMPHPFELNPSGWMEAKSSAIKAHPTEIKARQIAYQKEINSAAAQIRRERAGELMDLLARNVDPTTRTRIAVGLAGGTKIGIPGSEKIISGLSTGLSTARKNSSLLDNSLEGFRRKFVSSAGFGRDLNELRAASTGRASERTAVRFQNIRKMYSSVPIALREGAYNLYAHGMSHEPVLNSAGEDISRHFATRMDDLKGAIHDLGNDPSSINRWLTSKYHITKDKRGGVESIKSKDALRGSDPTTSWIDDSIETWGTKDPAEILWILESAVEKASARNSLWNSVAETFGIHSVGPSSTELGILRSKYGYTTVDDIPELSGKVYHPEVAANIKKLKIMLEGEKGTHSDRDIVNMLDKVQRYWKGAVTVYNPGFWERNMIGDVFVAWLAGVKNPKSYKQAMQTMRNRGGSENILLPDAASAIRERGVADAGHNIFPNRVPGTQTTKFRDVKSSHIDADLLWALYNKYGLKQGYVSTEFTTLTPKFGTLSNIDNKVRQASEMREDYFRLAHFIDKIKNSSAKTIEEAASEAAQSVRKSHFDYTDFTQFEKTVMSRIMPFYKWTRKSLPLMAETLLTQPGKALVYTKVSRDISGLLGYDTRGLNFGASDAIVPQYLIDSGAMPVGELQGNTTFINPAIPLNDSLKFADSPFKNAMGMISPFLRDPFELAAGHTTFTGAPIKSKTQYFLNQLPQSNVAQKLNTDLSGQEFQAGSLATNPNLLNFLVALGITSNTPSKMRGEAKRQRDAAVATRKKTKAEWEKNRSKGFK